MGKCHTMVFQIIPLFLIFPSLVLFILNSPPFILSIFDFVLFQYFLILQLRLLRPLLQYAIFLLILIF